MTNGATARQPKSHFPGARLTAGVALIALAATACTIAPAPEGPPAAAVADSLVPPGFGTLRQEQVSIVLPTDELEVMVTPLSESIIRVTAPDTYERLHSIAETHRRSAPAGSVLFLVSFYTQQSEVRFVPEEVQLLSRGLRLRPLSISPITPTWGQRRVRQRSTEMAVYAFGSDVDFTSDLILAYGLEQAGTWPSTHSRIQAERARARARAGIGSSRPPQASSSYFEIFR